MVSSLLFSQLEKKNLKSGELTLANGEIVIFKNLTWQKDKAFYTNIETNQKEELYDASIKNIIEKEYVKPINSNLYYPQYPEGVYVTKEDFLNKIPNRTPELTKNDLYGDQPILKDESPICFFFDEKDKKVKKVFAVVYNGILYFNVESILNNRHKLDRAQGSDNPNSFVQVLMGGDNYLYTEAPLANVWAKGLAYNAGVAGSVMAGNLNVGKGIVWDFKNQEFNIFKNCNDYNEFIKDKSPEDIQKCTNQQAENSLIKIALQKIK